MTTYIFRWDRHGRKGERCVVLVHDEQVSPKAVAITSVAVSPTQRAIAAIAGVPIATER